VGNPSTYDYRVRQLRADRLRGHDLAKALLASPSANTICTPDFDIDLLERCVRFPDGEEARFTPRQWRLLELLVNAAGRPVTDDVLARALFGDDVPEEAHQLPVLVLQLRRKLEPDTRTPRYVRSPTATTYVFDEDGGQSRPLGSAPVP